MVASPSHSYQICTKCVMDTSDPEIAFDAQGVCSRCRNYDELVHRAVLPGPAGAQYVERLVAQIKQAGAGHPYDCVIGVSGGVDSTFVAYKIKQLGLRPLAIHLDNGWDSELAVKNIEQTLKRLEIDLYTVVLDWEEFKDLQIAFLKASTPDSEIPTDHAILATLYRFTEKFGARHVIMGDNVRTESHGSPAWSQGHLDWRYIANVHKQFGTVPLKTYPHFDFLTWLRYRATIKHISLLNYLDYSKSEARRVLENEIGWKYYGGKHYESIYTRFYQGYLLPRKFGFDKRRGHLSSLICSGETTRAEALHELEQPPYPPAMQAEDYEYVIKKLNLTRTQFEAIMAHPSKSYWDYPSYGRLYQNPLYHAARQLYRAWQGRQRSA